MASEFVINLTSVRNKPLLKILKIFLLKNAANITVL